MTIFEITRLQQTMEKQAMEKQALAAAADFGSYFLPGVGTARMGYDAFKAFKGGRYLAGAGNLVGALASMVPGASVAAKGLQFGGKLLSKIPGLWNKIPTVRALGRGTANLATAGNKAYNTAAQNIAPRMTNFATKHSLPISVGGTATSVASTMADAGIQAGRAQADAALNRGVSTLKNLAQNSSVVNPMYANPNQPMQGFDPSRALAALQA